MHGALGHPPTLAETRLDERLVLLRPGLDQLGLPACVLDTSLRYRYTTAAYRLQSGKREADFTGRAADEIFAVRPTDDRREKLQQTLAGEAVVFYRQQIEGPQ